MGTATATRAVVSYERISRFREQIGNQTVESDRGVDRQAEDNNRCAGEFGLGAVDRHYMDNNRSASEYAQREREAWAELLADIADGLVGVLIVWVLDRIIRDPNDLEKLLTLCRENGVRIIQSASGSEIDPANPESILHARISGAVAAYEAAKTSMRIRRQKDSAAKAGKPHGGRRRFGYQRGNTVIDATEARVFRELVRRFLAGEALHRLAAELNADRVPGASGAVGKWTGPNLRHLLGNPAQAGLRVHKGEEYPGLWPGLIPVETHRQIVALLAQPGRRSNDGSNARRWLLSGLAVCGTCGTPVRGRPRSGRNESPAYRCSTGRHMMRRAEPIDEIITKAIIGRLARYDASGLLVDDKAAGEVTRLREARAALEDSYADLADALARGELSARAYGAATGALEAEGEALDAQIQLATATASQASRVLEGATGEGAAQAWAGWTLARRRALIAELAEIRIHGGKDRRDFDPIVDEESRTARIGDVEIHWR